MKILTVGGGSGGHVTPIRAVIDELKRSNENKLEVRFWSDRRFARQAQDIILADHPEIKTKAIFSGKLRRYHNTSLWRQLLDIPTLLKNVGDFLLLILGCLQSLWLLIIWRPDVIFMKGGFVCLPVGIAAHILRVPFVIHDSDAHPGLTNRILAPWARAIATGAPLKHYNYPKDKTSYVGIPLSADFKEFSQSARRATKKIFAINQKKPLVVITGGGLGAQRINEAALKIAPELLEKSAVVHLTGSKQFSKLKSLAPKSEDYKLLPFVSRDMAQLLGTADVVVTRAGATTMLELAASKKAVIIIPNALLTGGHQLKNAKVYQEQDAVLAVDEAQLKNHPEILLETILKLLDDAALRKKMGEQLGQFAKPNAARDIVRLIIKTANKEI